jgi:hypothetical protein
MEKRSVRTEEQKKEFAKEQVGFLKKHGIRDKERISRIFRCAGPGQIKESWMLATSENWDTNIGKIRKNLLDLIISGYGGSQELDWNAVADVLQLNGFYVPNVTSGIAFFKALDGALEIIIPGSYDFEDEDHGKANEEKTVQPNNSEP